MINLAAAKGLSTLCSTRCKKMPLGKQAFFITSSLNCVEAPFFFVEIKKSIDSFCFGLISHQYPGVAVRMRVISEGRNTTHPKSFLFGGCDFVSDAFGSHFALELCEGQQDVQRKPAHGCRCIEGLRNRHKGTISFLKTINQFGEVSERASQPVDLIDYDQINYASFNVIKKKLQGRALQGASGFATIVISLCDQLPTFMLLACDVSGTGLKLCIKRIETLLQTLLR